MGQGGKIALVNATPYNWTLTHQHSYQMASWGFPGVIPAGSMASVYVEWSEAVFHNVRDDGAEANYACGPDGENFQIQARAANGFDLRIFFENLQTAGNPKGSTLSLGWAHDGTVNFVLSGKSGAMHSSHPPAASWMRDNLAALRNRTLRQICMPGSHDAGMSSIGSHTAFANASNTQTQTKNILQQLLAGSRYFDIRPVVSAGIFKTGHYGFIQKLNSWQGANGQTIADIINDINMFTALNQELIILNLSHDLDTDVGNSSYSAFSQSQWNSLFAELQGIGCLYHNPTIGNGDLTQLDLGAFLGGGKSAVVVVVEPSGGNISLGNWAGKGFFTQTNLPVYNSYADSNDLGTMKSDQIGKLKAQRKSPNDGCFLLSWTLTQQGAQAVMGKSILDMAKEANAAICADLWPNISRQCFPNILYADDFPIEMTTLAIAINDFTA